MSYVLNPLTGRMVKIGGPTHRKLLQEENNLKRVLRTLSPSRKAKKSKLRQIIKSVKRQEGRGSRTRGWSAMSPQVGRERNELMSKCGKDCFLLPSKKKFPVCPALRVSKSCTPSCKGLLSSKIRAKQYKYDRVANLADKLLKMYC